MQNIEGDVFAYLFLSTKSARFINKFKKEFEGWNGIFLANYVKNSLVAILLHWLVSSFFCRWTAPCKPALLNGLPS